MIAQEIAAGRELDALIAEKVMGLRTYWHEYYLTGDGKLTKCGPYLNHQEDCLSVQREIPPYSTDIAAAWLVVERMGEKGYQFSLSRDGQGWTATFAYDDRCAVQSPSAPRAIVRAALGVLE